MRERFAESDIFGDSTKLTSLQPEIGEEAKIGGETRGKTDD